MHNSWIAIFPILISLITAIAACITWPWQNAQKLVHATGAFLLITMCAIVFYEVSLNDYLIIQIGNYKAPFGISIVIDHLSAIMLLLTGLITVSVAIYALAEISPKKQDSGFYPMFWILVLGITGAFSTGDIFNLYVWFEVMLIASFVLMVLGGTRAQLEGTVKYVALNLVATILMLVGIALLYGITGSLNMASIANDINSFKDTEIVRIIILILALAFSIKSAIFPLYFWLPASYHTTSVAASAIFAGMLTKVGVYALIRLLTLIYIPDKANDSLYLYGLLVLAGFTMITGVLGAASQFNFRKILSFHIISQVGYMIAGLAIYKPFAFIATIFYIVHHIIVKANLFLISGVVKRLEGSFNIKKLGNLYKKSPLLGILFLIPALSLAGIPPLSGFWAKVLIIKSAINYDHYVILAVQLTTGFLTLFSMLKIWNYVFWGDATKDSALRPILLSEKCLLIAPIIFLIVITIFISIYPEFLFNEAQKASMQLTSQKDYINFVLKGTA